MLERQIITVQYSTHSVLMADTSPSREGRERKSRSPVAVKREARSSVAEKVTPPLVDREKVLY